jgi:hypothetical protein
MKCQKHNFVFFCKYSFTQEYNYFILFFIHTTPAI